MSLYAVNGKVPVAAWIPSRDTAGNGTTTLTDLVGTNHGTLTNMDPATDWVADTGAGGVRALDFDGTNDRVSLPLNFNPNANHSISCWAFARNLFGGNQGFVAVTNTTNNSPRNIIGLQNNLAGPVYTRSGTELNSSVGITANTWFHVLSIYASTTMSIWVNGSFAGSSINTTTDTFNTVSLGAWNRTTPAFFLNGRLDDIRIFNTALDASDVAYLYNSGNGRGRIASNNQTFQLGMPI